MIYILEKYPFGWNMKDGLGKGKITGRKSSQNSLVIKERERGGLKLKSSRKLKKNGTILEKFRK